MSKYRILVCDDEPEKLLLLEKRLGSSEFSFTRVPGLEDLRRALVTDRPYPDAVFLDLVYPDGTEPRSPDSGTAIGYHQVKSVRDILPRSIPLFIYTRHTYRQTFLLRDLLNDDIVVGWIDYDRVARESEFELELLSVRNALRRDMADGLWLLHLSDQHFGSQFSHLGSSVGRRLPEMIERQLKESLQAGLGIRAPHAIVVSGDSTNSARADEFDAARDCLQGVAERVGTFAHGSKVPVIVAPGNHDFHWDLSIVDEHTIVSDEKSVPTLTERPSGPREFGSLKWLPFTQKFSPFLESSSARSRDGRWWLWDFSRRYGVSFIAANTAHRMTYRSRDILSPSAGLEEVEASLLTESSRQGGFNILVAHHPVSTWPDAESPELLEDLYTRLGVRVIFSGHRHRDKLNVLRLSGKRVIVEVQTGSLSGSHASRPEHVPAQYRVIGIVRRADGQWGQVRSWTMSYKDGVYTPHAFDAAGSFCDEAEFV